MLSFRPGMIFLPGISRNVALGNLLIREFAADPCGPLGTAGYAACISMGTFACFPRQTQQFSSLANSQISSVASSIKLHLFKDVLILVSVVEWILFLE